MARRLYGTSCKLLSHTNFHNIAKLHKLNTLCPVQCQRLTKADDKYVKRIETESFSLDWKQEQITISAYPDHEKQEETEMKKQIVRSTLLLTALVMMAGSALAADAYIRKDNEKLGPYISDENGMTLYTFKKDTPGKSACGAANDCVKKWPLFHADTIDSEVPMKNSDFSTIVRDDGAKQTTYKGMPLYYFAKDAKPGDVTGHGVNSIWSVARP